jgi:hypothetical protein
VAVIVLLVALGMSCRGGGKEQKATPTGTTTVSPTSTPTPQPVDIRGVDLSKESDVAALMQRIGGEVVPEDVIYADLTGDGQEEAVVPIFSGGTAGNLAFIVLGYRDGKLAALLTEVPAEGSVQVSVVNQQLVESLPVYSAGDLPGFPSEIKNVYYAWNGSSFVVAKELTVANPSAPPKQ